MIGKFDAIVSLRKGATFEVDSSGNVNWLDTEQTQPTDAEIAAEITRLEADYAAKQYQRDRAAAYPSVAEQLDMRYWDEVNGTTVWADTIAAIKERYPKP